MKKRSELYLISITAFFLFNIFVISASHTITTSTGGISYTFNESLISTYNITITNGDAGQDAKIVSVNITLPANLTFIASSQGTNAVGDFSNTPNLLTWSNTTNYLINGSETKNFWFNANATSGNYTLTISVLNSTQAYSYTINLTILKVITNTTNVTINATPCLQNWSCSSSWSNCTSGTQTRTCTDVNSCGNNTGKPATTQNCTTSCIQNWSCTGWSLCNSSGQQTKTCTDTKSCNNATGKPVTMQSCTPPCTQNWNCTWTPEECPKSKNQTKSCKDLNSCGNNTGKPEETRVCEYKSNTGNILFISVIAIIGILILVVGFVVYKKFKAGSESTTQEYPYAEQGGYGNYSGEG